MTVSTDSRSDASFLGQSQYLIIMTNRKWTYTVFHRN